MKTLILMMPFVNTVVMAAVLVLQITIFLGNRKILKLLAEWRDSQTRINELDAERLDYLEEIVFDGQH